MPRPKLYNTREEKREAHRLQSINSHHRRKDEINERRRGSYAIAKKRALRAEAREERRVLGSQPSQTHSTQEPPRRETQEPVSRNIGELAARFRAQTAGSTLGFLTSVCEVYEKKRHTNETAARHDVELHIGTFTRLAEQAEDILESIPRNGGGDLIRSNATRIARHSRNVLTWLEEVREAIIIHPATVMVRFVSRGFLFQLDGAGNIF